MKKALLLLVAVLVSLSTTAAKVVVTTQTEYPNYAGYFETSGSADYLYDRLIEAFDVSEFDGGSITADRDTHTVKMIFVERGDYEIDIMFTMTFTTEQDRIYYKLKMDISSDGKDLTETMLKMGLGKDFNKMVEEMLREIANEL